MLCQYNPSIPFMAGKIDNLFRSDLSVKEISFLYKHIIKRHVVQQNPLLPLILIGLQFLKDLFESLTPVHLKILKIAKYCFKQIIVFIISGFLYAACSEFIIRFDLK